MNLVSSRSRVSKLEFFVALALVALAQAGKGELNSAVLCKQNFMPVVDVSIEQVAALSSHNTLPEPTLDLNRLQASASTFNPPMPSYRQNSNVRSPAPAYSEDPWNSNPRLNPGVAPNSGFGGATGSNIVSGIPSSLSGTGLPAEWWKSQENVRLTILGQHGFILNRYTVYEISTDVSRLLFLILLVEPFLCCSVAPRFPDATRNLCISGSALFVATPSASFHLFLLNG